MVVTIFRGLLFFIGIIFILLGLSRMMICSLSMPPQCGTLMDAAPFFSVSIICFMWFFYLGRTGKSKMDDNDKQKQTDDVLRKIQPVLLKLILALFCLLIVLIFFP